MGRLTVTIAILAGNCQHDEEASHAGRPDMNPSRLRFSVRRMMFAVAIASIILGVVAEVVRLSGLRALYRSRAAFHTREVKRFNLAREIAFRERVRIKREGVPDSKLYFGSDILGLAPRIRAPFPFIDKLYEKELNYRSRALLHGGLKEKWERSADRPWLSVEPDPPESE